MKLDVQALGADFVAISGHKMCGPSGVGVALGPGRAAPGDGAVHDRRPHDQLRPRRQDDVGRAAAQVRGGHGADRRGVGLGAAIDYLEAIGLDAIEAHEHELAAYALGRLGEVPGIKLYGPPAERRAGIVSFNLEGIHPHDVAQILDLQGVAIRAGHHCCQPLMQKLGVAATNRASFYLYTIPEEIDQLVEGLYAVRKVFA